MAGPRVGKTIREKTSLLPGSCAPSGHLRAVGVSPFTSPPPATGKGSVRTSQAPTGGWEGRRRGWQRVGEDSGRGRLNSRAHCAAVRAPQPGPLRSAHLDDDLAQCPPLADTGQGLGDVVQTERAVDPDADV